MNSKVSVFKSHKFSRDKLSWRIWIVSRYLQYEKDFCGKILKSRILTKKQYLDLKLKAEVNRAYKLFSEQLQLEKYSSPEPVTISKSSHPLFLKLNQFTSVANLLLFAMFTLLLFSSFSYAGDVTLTGRIANQQNVGLSNKTVTVFLNGSTAGLTATTGVDGRYNIPFTSTGVEYEPTLPDGYALSNNYPNPFNPSTFIDVTLPHATQVKIDLYNVLGQEVGNVVDDYLSAGKHPVRIDLGDVSEGVYFARVVFDEKYSDVKKLLFLRNSQHAANIGTSSENNASLDKTLQDVADSLHVSGRSILPMTAVLNSVVSGNLVDFGTTIVDSALNVDGQVISTIRYDEPNNYVGGVEVIIDGYSAVADALGQFSLQVPVGDSLRNMDIQDPGIWLREKKIFVDKDTSNVIEDVLTKQDFPDSVMNYFNKVSGRINPYSSDVLTRFIDKPIFYIVADTTQQWDKDFTRMLNTFIRGTLNDVMKGRKYPEGFLKDAIIEVGTNPPNVATPGYHVIRTSTEMGNAAALTYRYGDPVANPPNIISCETVFGKYPQPDSIQIKRLMGHELASGIVYMGRNDDLVSWYNWGPPFSSANPSKTDTLMLRAVFSRDTGWDMEDKDWGR